MRIVTTMAFFMLCCERLRAKTGRFLLLALLMGACLPVWAQTSPSPVAPLQLARSGGAVLLSTQLDFELPSVVKQALDKGIPIYFVMTAKLLRERWYWTNETLSTTQRHTRLSYHPLTRRWRISTVAPEPDAPGQGLSLDQNFDTLPEALAALRRISGWRIAEDVELSVDAHYLVAFSFELDVSQLPRPLQLGTLGPSDWRLTMSRKQPFEIKAAP
jgi:hypothetical protein